MVANWRNGNQNIKNAIKHFLSSPTIPGLMEKSYRLSGYSFNNSNRETKFFQTVMDLLGKKNTFSTPFSSELWGGNVATRFKF